MEANTKIRPKKVIDIYTESFHTHQSLLIACVRKDSNISEFKQNVEKSWEREGERDGGEEGGGVAQPRREGGRQRKEGMRVVVVEWYGVGGQAQK